MGRLMVGGIVLACAALAATGGAVEAVQQNWAESLFNEHAIDFGPVPRGAKVRHRFVLTNRLNETITVLDVRASCGCTSGFAGTTTIEPGKTSYIEAQMDTQAFVGIKATTLTVTLITASGATAEAKFAVRSNILADIVLNPGSIDFSRVAKGGKPSLVLSIERGGSPEWRATRMVSTSKALDAKLAETYRSAAGVGYQLTVSLKPGAPAGLMRDEIRIITNDPDSPVVPVLVTADIQGTISAAPATLALGNIPKNGASGRFIVKGTKPFKIRAVEGNGEGFTLAAGDGKAKAMHVLTMTYDPSRTNVRGDLKRTFRVLTDQPDEAPLDVTTTLHIEP